MKARRYWNGVRMRTTVAAADPDSPQRAITLPSDWDEAAAAALARLAPGEGAATIAAESERWIEKLTLNPELPTLGDDSAAEKDMARSLVWLLLLRQAAPTLSLWNGEPDRRPGFIVNLAAFVLPGEGFAGETFAAALRMLAATLRSHGEHEPTTGELPFPDLKPDTAAPRPAAKPQPDPQAEANPGLPFATRPAIAGEILLTNLDACLAALGFDYDSPLARDAACALAALTTLIMREGAGIESLPLPPSRNVVPGLAPVAREAWSRAAVETDAPVAPIETGFSTPGPIDALLGVEACGLAPIFSPLREDGRLAASTLVRLAQRGLTLEAAFAASLAGEPVLPLPGPDAHGAMYRALAGFVDRLPARPEPAAPPLPRRLPRGVARPLPARHDGFTQKASIGGHKLFLRTGEYEDGTLGEITLTPTRETPMARGLMESFSEAVSIGLQHGAPLEEYVRAFAYSCFGPAGTVEGDPVASYATSMLDYAFRALSDAYLGKRLPDAPHMEDESAPDPLLPFDFPEGSSPRHRELRLVV